MERRPVVIVRNPTREWMRSFRSFEDHLHIDVLAILVGGGAATAAVTERIWSRKTSDMYDAASRMREMYPEYDKILCLPSRPVTAPISALFEIMKPGAINVFFDDRSAWGIFASDAAACRERKTFDPVRFDVFGAVPRLAIDSRCATLYVNHHDDASEEIARRTFRDWPFVSHVRIPTTPILENIQYCSDLLLSRKSEWKNKAFVGTIAYSAMRKLWFRDPIDFSKIPASTDVIALYPGDNRQRRIDLIEHGEAMHRGFARVWIMVMDVLGVPEAHRNPEPFFSNYFMMAPAHFERFCVFMRRAWAAVQEDDATHEALYRESASYPGRMTRDMLVDMYGVPWYPFFTFVFERLCPVFCSMEGLDVHFYFRPINFDI